MLFQEWIAVQTEEYLTDEWWVGLHYGAGWDWVQYGGDKQLMLVPHNGA